MVPLRYNVRNLVVRWRTTLLTALGFMLVVSLLVIMLAFVSGLNALAKKAGPEGNVIVLRDGTIDELMSELDVNAVANAEYQAWNRFEEIIRDGDEPRASKEVYSLVSQELPRANPEDRAEYRFIQIRGVENPRLAGLVHGLTLREGTWLDRSGTQVNAGEGIARTLGLKVGDVFEPKPGLKWTVVGILESQGAPFDSEIWAKREEVGRLFGKDNEEKKQSFYTSVVISTPDAASALSLAAKIKKDDSVRVNAMPERQYYEAMSKGNLMFKFAAVFIAIVMAAGGMFGLMNTMFAAVSQRIKDIGVLRILGYGRGQILLSFLMESLLLAVLGGGLGLLIGYAFNGVEQTGVMTAGQGGGMKLVVFKMVVDREVIGYAVGFTLAMGLLGGLLPALSAMRLKVLDCVR